jgi:phosphatidylethanolamine-binding protein (PEBP) family uncharacterized protein
MPGIDANQVKAVLLKIKAQKQAGKGRNNAEAFRQGIANKREATRLLSSIVTPFTPAQVTLDTPFLIWTLRDPDAPYHLGRLADRAGRQLGEGSFIDCVGRHSARLRPGGFLFFLRSSR